MKTKIHLLMAFLLLPLLSYSQNAYNQLLPVKVNQKWGLIDTLGNIRVEPQFDNLNKLNTNFGKDFFLIGQDKKIGLLKANGQKLLSANYRRIRPLSENYFAVVKDSLEIVIDKNENQILDAVFDYVTMLNAQFFVFKKENLWGVYKRKHGVLFEPQFDEIKPINTGKGYFGIMRMAASTAKWGLWDIDGNEIIPLKYDNIDVIDDNKILVLEKELWGMVDANGKTIFEPQYRSYGKLSKYYSIYTTPEWQQRLYLNLKDTFLNSETQYNSYNLMWQDSTKIMGRTMFKIAWIDTLGNTIIPPLFENIQAYSDSIYKVKDGAWGLYHLRDSILLDTDFDVIEKFRNDGFAFVRIEGNVGLINRKYEVVIPAIYDKLKLLNGVLKAYDGSNLTFFKQTADDKFELSDAYANVKVLRLNSGGNNNSNFTTNQSASWLSPLEFGKYRWRRTKDGLYGVQETAKYGVWVVEPQFEKVKVLHKQNITLVYTQDTNQVKYYPIFGRTNQVNYHQVKIFSNQNLQIISNENMIGIRAVDFNNGSSTAAFLGANGKFGLIHKNGQTVKRPTELFIKKYQNGLFAIPKGKQIMTNNQSSKLDFASSRNLHQDFHIHFFERKSNVIQTYYQVDRGLWGYYDQNSREVIPPRFTVIGRFLPNNKVINRTQTGWGMIDNTGKVIIPFKYDNIQRYYGDKYLLRAKNNLIITLNSAGRTLDDQYIGQGQFFEGFARVAKRDTSGKLIWGFVNEQYEEILPCQYIKVKNFKNGQASVFDTAWHFINTTGEVVVTLPKAVKDIGEFHYDLAWVKVGSKNYGYVNALGKFVIKPKLTKAGNFTEFDVANAAVSGQSTLIDKTGTPILEFGIYGNIFNIEPNGLAKVQHPRRRLYGFIDYTGKQVLAPIYDQISPFKDGIATTRLLGKSGFLHESGKVIVDPQYDKTGNPSEGLIAVYNAKDKVWKYIDYQGKVAIEDNFLEAADFFQGQAVVTIKQIIEKEKELVTALIDKTGKYQFVSTSDKSLKYHTKGFRIIQFAQLDQNTNQPRLIEKMYYADENNYNIFGKHYTEAFPFENELGFVVTNDGWGAVNQQGFTVVTEKYIRLIRTKDGNIRGKARYFYGFCDLDGNMIQPVEFDRVLKTNKYYQVERDGKIGYLDLKGEWIWEIQE